MIEGSGWQKIKVVIDICMYCCVSKEWSSLYLKQLCFAALLCFSKITRKTKQENKSCWSWSCLCLTSEHKCKYNQSARTTYSSGKNTLIIVHTVTIFTLPTTQLQTGECTPSFNATTHPPLNQFEIIESFFFYIEPLSSSSLIYNYLWYIFSLFVLLRRYFIERLLRFSCFHCI